MFNKKSILFIILFLPFLTFAQATVTRIANATVIVRSFMSVSVSHNGIIDYKFNKAQELQDGITLSNKFNVTVTSNNNWVLYISSLTSTFQSSGYKASTQIPPEILSIKKNRSSVFVPINQNPQIIASGFKGDGTNPDNNFKIDIKATPGYNYNGGNYGMALVFTLSNQ